ncbi:MAG: UPF0280 family protein [Methanomicrobiales archaeon]|nr:UPF0280 family protein [Methanomicrobiales archaeon]
MIRRHFQYRQTIATILAEKEEHIMVAIEGMLAARREIEECVARDPFFAITYSPYTPNCTSTTIRRMCDAAERAQVGPMAAVAGTIAWAGVDAMQQEGAVFGVIDNGGDIALVSGRPIRVGIHAGDAVVSDRLAFVVPPQDIILGICTSSATVGPSVSLGTADAVTVFARDVSLADAWATAICNQISSHLNPETLGTLDPAIQGVLVVRGADAQVYGDLPPLVPAKVNHDLITKGKAVYR